MIDPLLALLLLITTTTIIAVPAYDLGERHGFDECMRIRRNKREKETE